MVNKRDEIYSGSQIPDFERKDKMSTKVIDETTLRIYFPKGSNTEPVSQDLPLSTTPTTTPSKSIVPERAIEVKDKEKAINTQGFSLWLIIYHSDVLRCTLDKYLEINTSAISVTSRQKTFNFAK